MFRIGGHFDDCFEFPCAWTILIEGTGRFVTVEKGKSRFFCGPFQARQMWTIFCQNLVLANVSNFWALERKSLRMFRFFYFSKSEIGECFEFSTGRIDLLANVSNFRFCDALFCRMFRILDGSNPIFANVSNF